jgi:dienelactone hydrolase
MRWSRRQGFAIVRAMADSLTLATRFRDSETVLAGVAGQVIEVASANPLNYHQMVSQPAAMPRLTIDGKLFVPKGARGPQPVVVIVPGSLGIAPSHLAHAETLLGEGLGAFVLDPFGPRDVTSTVANQTQFSFAASTYDVIAAVKTLAARPEIDATRIGLQGHSRGGTAVMLAAMRRLNAGVLGDGAIASVLAAYPWCGHQPTDPGAGGAEIRVLIGDRDDWVSAQQAQGFVQAIRLRGGTATIRIFAGASHSFDRGVALTKIPDARVSPAAPTAYLADDGSFIHPATGVADPALVDRDLAIYSLKAGYGVKGATIGSQGDQAELFRADMIEFFQRTLR